MIIAHLTKNASASQSRKVPTNSRNEEEKISDEEEDSFDEIDDDVDIIRELLENLSKSKRKTHPVERKSTLPELFFLAGSELMDGWVCAILALEVVPKNLIFT